IFLGRETRSRCDGRFAVSTAARRSRVIPSRANAVRSWRSVPTASRTERSRTIGSRSVLGPRHAVGVTRVSPCSAGSEQESDGSDQTDFLSRLLAARSTPHDLCEIFRKDQFTTIRELGQRPPAGSRILSRLCTSSSSNSGDSKRRRKNLSVWW